MAITRDTKKTRDAVATQSEFVGIGDGAKPTVPQDVLDLELFEELRDLLGHEETKAALKELLSTLKNNFPDISAADLDREEVHVRAHFVVARAGMMGFTTLSNACSELQDACTMGAAFSSEYARARKAAVITSEAITCLLKQSIS